MRWTIRRKAEFIKQVLGLSFAERQDFVEQSTISWDEFLSWLDDYTTHGLNGLRVTKRPV